MRIESDSASILKEAVMAYQTFHCEKNCRNTCAALTRALQLESEIVRLSEEMIDQCDDETVRLFIADLAENSSEKVLLIMQKLNEVRARMHIFNNMDDMFH